MPQTSHDITARFPASPMSAPVRRLAPVFLLAALLLCFGGRASPATASTEAAAPPAGERKTDARDAGLTDVETVRRELAAEVTDKTRGRLEQMKSRKAMSPAAADIKLARLASLADTAYMAQAVADADRLLRPVLGGGAPSQYFVYVDRNPARQLIFLGVYDAASDKVELLGGDLVSTGLLRRGQDSFLTPTGVFEHLPENFGYRAQGTRNQHGWRGLGGKGSRVWDFGFQQSPREFRQGVYESQMRLLMHATDPDQGEPRLGGMDSKGCVRVSANMNRFLDRRSILDRHYERLAAENPGMWLLAPDRSPVSAPGSFMAVGDSSTADSAAR